MIRFYAAAIPCASQQLLSVLSDLAKASPLSSTKARLSLREKEGLVFNGALVAGTPSRCATTSSVLTHILDLHVSLSSCAHSLSVPALYTSLPRLVQICRAVLLIAFENGATPVLCNIYSRARSCRLRVLSPQRPLARACSARSWWPCQTAESQPSRKKS